MPILLRIFVFIKELNLVSRFYELAFVMKQEAGMAEVAHLSLRLMDHDV